MPYLHAFFLNGPKNIEDIINHQDKRFDGYVFLQSKESMNMDDGAKQIPLISDAAEQQKHDFSDFC